MMKNAKNTLQNSPLYIQKWVDYFSIKNNRIKLVFIIISLFLTGFLFVKLGNYQLALNRIKKGKTEYKNENWRVAYHILFKNRNESAFDKEACQMLGCMIEKGFGDRLERPERAQYWLNKAGLKECPKGK
jgi:hypothetical protein